MVPQNHCCYCRTFWTSDYIKSVFQILWKYELILFFFVMCQKRYRSFPSAIFDLINNIISKIIIDLNCVYILQKISSTWNKYFVFVCNILQMFQEMCPPKLIQRLYVLLMHIYSRTLLRANFNALLNIFDTQTLHPTI